MTRKKKQNKEKTKNIRHQKTTRTTTTVRPEYGEKSRPEETYCHSNSCERRERLSANAGVKNSL